MLLHSAYCSLCLILLFVCFFFFFFQAEDGIRDYKVTGVQTCALPIWYWLISRRYWSSDPSSNEARLAVFSCMAVSPLRRSEERRVGKECRSRWSPYH